MYKWLIIFITGKVRVTTHRVALHLTWSWIEEQRGHGKASSYHTHL